ncbi:hypothetical protein, partial [Asanoa sp. NPDC050611]|uniref:hypothetical protein n=1 Tax=Asanoa sp. NPDC050611 TaxID=3157098 RepID=UPI0033DD5B0C
MSSGDYVEIDFGAGPANVPASTRQLTLGGRKSAVPVPADGPVDWSRLDRLPDLDSLSWTGADRGVVAFVAGRRITYLEWLDAAGDIDLTPTKVAELRMTAADLRSLRLPASTTMLLLRDPPPTVEVDAPHEGLDLRIFFGDQEPAIPAGVAHARKVWVKAGRAFSARVLTGLADVESLDIELLDPPGTLTDTDGLAALPRLRALTVENAYDWDPATLPDLPALRELDATAPRWGARPGQPSEPTSSASRSRA